jgi:hypothetical protein
VMYTCMYILWRGRDGDSEMRGDDDCAWLGYHTVLVFLAC